MPIAKQYNTAIYVRLSREDGDKEESDSISVQKKMLLEYIESDPELVLYDIFADDGYSGTNFERPAFQKMVSDIKDGKIQCVIIKDLSRLGRDYLGTGYYIEKVFPNYRVRFIAVNDHIDNIGDRDYDMLLPIRNIMNEQYARDISTKVQSAFKTKQKLGEFVGAFPSYGYMKSPDDRHQLVIDEEAAAVVREIYDLYIHGCPKLKIAKILNDKGIPCPTEYKKSRGMKYRNSNKLVSTSYWTYATIHKILSNSMYRGDMVQGKTRRRMKARPVSVEKDKWIVVQNTHEAIISNETWEKAQKMLSIRTREYNFNNNIGLFCGILFCGDCGRAMHKKIEKGKYIYYRCRTYVSVGSSYCTAHNISENLLSSIILSDINTMLKNLEDFGQAIQKFSDAQKKNSEHYRQEIVKVKTEIAKCQDFKKSSYVDYKEGLITKEEYLSYREELIQKEQSLESRICELSAKQQPDDVDSILNNAHIAQLLSLKEIDTLNRQIVLDIIDRIDVYDDKRIKITYVFSDDMNVISELVNEYCTGK